MARVWIFEDTIRVSVPGVDVLSASGPDDYLLNSDLLPDQTAMAGVASFGGGNTAAITLPSTHTAFKIDFFYCVISGGDVTQTLLPDSLVMMIDGTEIAQLTAEFDTGDVVFARRGNIADEDDRGVRYVIYASALP